MIARNFKLFVLAGAAALTLAAGCDKGPSTSNAASAAEPDKTQAEPAKETESHSETTKAASVEGKVFGAGVDLPESVAISAIVDDPKAFDGKTVRVEGMIIDVCPKRGCWFEMAGDAPGKKMRFKVQDGVMVFPMDAKGKYAVAQGVVAVHELTLEQTKEHAVYQAEEKGEQLDPASVTEPEMIVRIDGTGAVVRDAK